MWIIFPRCGQQCGKMFSVVATTRNNYYNSD
jgi:hypothetical protein